MDLERLKEYIQNYLDTVISPKVNSTNDEIGVKPITFSVYVVKEGSYQPRIIHIFLDTEPEIRKSNFLKPWAKIMTSRVEKDLESFLKIFSITDKVKIHWNKRPLF